MPERRSGDGKRRDGAGSSRRGSGKPPSGGRQGSQRGRSGDQREGRHARGDRSKSSDQRDGRRRDSEGGRSGDQRGGTRDGGQRKRPEGDDRRRGDERGRAGPPRKSGGQPPRRAYSVEGGPSNIPRWLRDEIARVTPKDRRDPVLVLFSEAASDFADEKFGRSYEKLVRAKQMASRAAAIRELLGLTAYRMQRWDEALRELRAFRRMAGDTTHMPVEMDTLRALGRPGDVRKVWALFQELGGRPVTDAEARVVYGSFLLDEGDPRAAWEVTKPGRLTKDARLGDVRRWYVAARAALALGDAGTARQIARAIGESEEGQDMAGLEELDAEITRTAARRPS